MERLDVSVGEAQGDVDLNRQAVVFDGGAIPVGVVSKELLCFGNRGRTPMSSLLRRRRTTFSLSGQTERCGAVEGEGVHVEDSRGC